MDVKVLQHIKYNRISNLEKIIIEIFNKKIDKRHYIDNVYIYYFDDVKYIIYHSDTKTIIYKHRIYLNVLRECRKINLTVFSNKVVHNLFKKFIIKYLNIEIEHIYTSISQF